MSTGNGRPIVLVVIGGVGNNVISSFASAREFSRSVYGLGVEMPLVPALLLPVWRADSKVTEADLDGLSSHYAKLIESGVVAAVKFIGKCQDNDRLRQLCADNKIRIA